MLCEQSSRVLKEFKRIWGLWKKTGEVGKDIHSGGCYKTLKLRKKEILGYIKGKCNWSDHIEPHHTTFRQ